VKRIVRSALATILLLGTGTAQADPVTLIENIYTPTMNSKGGRIDGCSLTWGAFVQDMRGGIHNVAGSVTKWFFEGKQPSVSVKVAVSRLVGNQWTPARPVFASIRSGKYDTRPLGQMDGDGASRLVFTSMDTHEEMVFNFADTFIANGAWVSYQLAQNEGDFTFQLPAFGPQDEKTQREFFTCYETAMGNFIREVEAMAGTR
jgi:hypothetical protein